MIGGRLRFSGACFCKQAELLLHKCRRARRAVQQHVLESSMKNVWRKNGHWTLGMEHWLVLQGIKAGHSLREVAGKGAKRGNRGGARAADAGLREEKQQEQDKGKGRRGGSI